jgi:hydroxyacylglutathione hydrolase
MHAFIGILLAIESLQMGTLPRQWRPSGPNCTEVPDWQVHEYNANTWIIRESGCTNYEKPFLYLIFGENKALLQDTGAGKTDIDRLIPNLLAQWAKRNNKPVPPLLVVHSHSHGDHVSGDKQLAALPNVTVVPAKPEEIEKALAMPGWPEKLGVIDLGGNRQLDAIPIPGHDAADLALYDRQTGLLLTGDTVYPGRLYVRNFPEYVKSIDRLVNFAKDRPIAHVLGTHIEQARTPFTDYKVRTVYQPDEAVLELSRGDLLELQSALAEMKGKPRRQELSRFTIFPRVALP